MGLTLTVLGCCGTYPAPGGACSGYLVQGGGTTVWLDAGTGTLANLQRHVAFHDLDAVVLTHAHPDHWTDALTFFNVCRFLEERKGVRVFSPAEVLDLARRFTGEPAPTFDWSVVSGGDTVEAGGLTVSFARTDHGPETLGVRIDGGGSSLAYSSDTGPAWSLSELGAGADLALCEATYLRDQEGTTQHLSARQAGATARHAGAGRLLLTHLWPTVDADDSRAEAEAAFGAPVEMATTNERYEL